MLYTTSIEMFRISSNHTRCSPLATPAVSRSMQLFSSGSSSSRSLHMLPQLYRQRHRPNNSSRPSVIISASLGNNMHVFTTHGQEILQTILSNTSTAIAHLYTAVTMAQNSIDPAVLGATANASFKLFLICAVVGWLLQTKRIPNATASVLSQISFQLLIPCMLLSKVSGALSAQPDVHLLFGVVGVTLVQVAIGTFWGLLLSPLVDGSYSKKLQIFGWHPANPPKSVMSITSSLSLAVGVPQLAPALVPKPVQAPQGYRQLIAASCAFGNSFTLPGVFFLTLLPSVLVDKAMAYAALFLLAWSPAMWSVGLSIIESGGDNKNSKENEEQDEAKAIPAVLGAAIVEPIKTLLLSQSPTTATASVVSFDEDDHEVKESAIPSTSTSTSNSITINTLVNALATSLKLFLQRTLNPPIWGILVGCALGLSSLGRAILAAAKAPTGTILPGLPPELVIAQAGIKGALEVVELMSSGTLGIQTLVLAASLLQQQTSDGSSSDTTTSTTTTALTISPPSSNITSVGRVLSGGKKPGKLRGIVGAVFRALSPVDAMEARALGVLSLVRFLLVPVCSLVLLKWAVASRVLPSVLASDPIFLFVVMVESVMPSAQNLIILLQLSDRTRGTAPAFARMLLKLYAYAVLPVTLWVTYFASRLSIFALA